VGDYPVIHTVRGQRLRIRHNPSGLVPPGSSPALLANMRLAHHAAVPDLGSSFRFLD
jgi:hypothetical protein